MRNDVAAHLRRINSKFYQTFGQSFADTRGRLQPGVLKLVDALPQEAAVLDLGCGHGQLARWRVERGDTGLYCGVDSSPSLLALTRDLAANENISFSQIDLAEAGWAEPILTTTGSAPNDGFDRIFAFAVMHHLPGHDTRQDFVHQLTKLLRGHGRVAVSNWNFLASQRLRERILPWETIELEAEDVDPGDHLLDWRRDGHGVRYVHHFEDQELTKLAESAGLVVIDRFYSDGETGNLGLYQVWAREEAG